MAMGTELLAYPDDPMAHAISGVLIGLVAVALLGFLLYGFLTRYREDWDELLRRWQAEQPPDDDR
jgi:hypothetical protein